jgi:hypothetical protein
MTVSSTLEAKLRPPVLDGASGSGSEGAGHQGVPVGGGHEPLLEPGALGLRHRLGRGRSTKTNRPANSSTFATRAPTPRAASLARFLRAAACGGGEGSWPSTAGALGNSHPGRGHTEPTSELLLPPDDTYAAFSRSGHLFTPNCDYIGWIEDDGRVFKADGSFMGEVYNERYIVRRRAAATPARRARRARPARPARPAPRSARRSRAPGGP